MKKTRTAALFPMNMGLDRTSIPGTQDHRSLRVAKNIIIGSTPSLKKRPGQRRIPYIGQDSGVQAVTHFFATTGNSQAQEVIRVRKGRIEALRDLSGSEPQFVDLGVQVSDTDTVTFERFGNALIIHFENTQPYRYTIGGDLTALEILSGHTTTPPTFSRTWDFSFWYSGRRAAPHRVYKSAPNDFTNYTLRSGGGEFRINDGDGDPVGITALSPSFRGHMYMYKWERVYRMYRGGYGYGWDEVSDEFGAVHHNCVAASKRDLYSVDTFGIQGLLMNIQSGASSEDSALTRSIYEYFQESINWSAFKNMVLLYDKTTATLLLSYPKGGSHTPTAVLGMNVFTNEFFEWENVEYPSMCKYFEFGRRRVMVADNERGLCVLDNKENTLEGDPISLEWETGLIFPLGAPQREVNFTEAWLLCRPTHESVYIDIYYSINGKEEVKKTVDMSGAGYGAVIAEVEGGDGGVIGTDSIGKMDEDLASIPFTFSGDGSSVRFRAYHSPPADDADQGVEIYGIVYRYEYDEETEEKVTA